MFKNIYYFGSSNRIKKFEVTTIPPYETRDLLEFTKTYPNQKIIQLRSVSDVSISIDNRSFYYTYAEVKKPLTFIVSDPIKEFYMGQPSLAALIESVREISPFDPSSKTNIESAAQKDLQSMKILNPRLRWYNMKFGVGKISNIDLAFIRYVNIVVDNVYTVNNTSSKRINFVKNNYSMTVPVSSQGASNEKSISIPYEQLKGYYDSSKVIKFSAAEAKSIMITSANTVLFLYNEYTKKVYYTPTDV